MKTFIALLFLAVGVDGVNAAEFSDLKGFETAVVKAEIPAFVCDDGVSLPMPQVYNGPSGVQMVSELKNLLKSTAGQFPDPLGKDREKLMELLKGNEPAMPAVRMFFDKYIQVRPEQSAEGAVQQNISAVPGFVSGYGASLPMPQIYSGPSGVQMARELKNLLKSTAGQFPDPLGGDREKLTELLKENEPAMPAVRKFFDKYILGRSE
ncbi:MAG: hypothetical protein WCK76_05045 [Elusimicrobiota bacterium]